jgi:hypothetical protein
MGMVAIKQGSQRKNIQLALLHLLQSWLQWPLRAQKLRTGSLIP